MKLIRRDPIADWPAFGSFFRDWPERLHLPETLVLDEDDLRVEEYMEDGTLVIRVEAAGVDPDEDIDLEVSGGRLTIRAERRHEEEHEDRRYLRREMHYGSFARSLPLPTGVKEEDIKATFADGILEVKIPVESKEEADQATKVPIERAS